MENKDVSGFSCLHVNASEWICFIFTSQLQSFPKTCITNNLTIPQDDSSHYHEWMVGWHVQSNAFALFRGGIREFTMEKKQNSI